MHYDHFRLRGLEGGGGGWCNGRENIPLASGVKIAENEMKQNNGRTQAVLLRLSLKLERSY